MIGDWLLVIGSIILVVASGMFLGLYGGIPGVILAFPVGFAIGWFIIGPAFFRILRG